MNKTVIEPFSFSMNWGNGKEQRPLTLPASCPKILGLWWLYHQLCTPHLVVAMSFFPGFAYRLLKGTFLKLWHTCTDHPRSKSNNLSGCRLQTSPLRPQLLQIAETPSLNMKLLVSKHLRGHEKVEQRSNLYKAGDRSS